MSVLLTQKHIWTADKPADDGIWYVTFYMGLCYNYLPFPRPYVRAVRSFEGMPERGVLRYSLRSAVQTLSKSNVKEMIEKYDYFCADNSLTSEYNNPSGKGIVHQYQLQQSGKVVYDAATGLYWQQSGVSASLSFERAQDYIIRLNNEKYGGYDDWRLPTLEEAMSLLSRKGKMAARILIRYSTNRRVRFGLLTKLPPVTSGASVSALAIAITTISLTSTSVQFVRDPEDLGQANHWQFGDLNHLVIFFSPKAGRNFSKMR